MGHLYLGAPFWTGQDFIRLYHSGSSHPTLFLSPAPFLGVRYTLHFLSVRHTLHLKTFSAYSYSLLLYISQAFLPDKHVSQQVSSCTSNSIPVFLPGTHAIIKFVLSINKAKLTYISCLTTTLPMGLYLTPCNSSIC